MFKRQDVFKSLSFYNALIAVLLLYNYRNNPKANTPEYFYDFCTHLISAAQLSGLFDQYFEHRYLSGAYVGINRARLSNIGYKIVTGVSSFSLLANIFDMGFHFLNLFVAELKDENDVDISESGRARYRPA